MNPTKTDDAVTRVLDEMLALTASVEQAVHALSRNSLPEFEDSLWLQETLGQLLRRSIQKLRCASVSAADRSALRTVAARLLQIVCSYDAVVGEGAKMAAFLRELSNFHQCAPTAEHRGANALLSCEV